MELHSDLESIANLTGLSPPLLEELEQLYDMIRLVLRFLVLQSDTVYSGNLTDLSAVIQTEI